MIYVAPLRVWLLLAGRVALGWLWWWPVLVLQAAWKILELPRSVIREYRL